MYNVICRQNQTVTRGQRTTSTQGSPALDIDAGLFSKIERGERPAKREQVIALTSILHTNEKKLLTLWLAKQIKEITESEKKNCRRCDEKCKNEIKWKYLKKQQEILYQKNI